MQQIPEHPELYNLYSHFDYNVNYNNINQSW